MNDIVSRLNQEIEAAKTLRAQLIDIIGDEQSMAEAVDSETYLNEVIDVAVQKIVDDQALLTGLADMIGKLQARSERLDGRVKSIRTALHLAMEYAGRQTIEHPAVTLSRKKSPPSVEITDESAIPGSYWERQSPKLDKRTLLNDLRAGVAINGAKLSEETQTLQLRWL